MIAALDDLDDLSSAELPLIRFCGSEDCTRVTRPGGRDCRPCHAATVRRWREAHRTPLAVRRRDAAAARGPDARARDSARSALAMAIRRGKMVRGVCGVCGCRKDVIAKIADPAVPLDVRWICRTDQRAEREARRLDENRRAAAAALANWGDERTAALAAIARLPSAAQAELHAIAARGPLGRIQLSPSAPMYTILLVRAYHVMVAKEGHDDRRQFTPTCET